MFETNLRGRLRNTSLPVSNSLMPLYEAVVNSIHSTEELSNDNSASIHVEVVRSKQTSMPLGADTLEKIVGFAITDNGAGFNDQNLKSFKTLDSDYKAEKGCRGVGRLLWLKAFRAVEVKSVFAGEDGRPKQRTFSFNENTGLSDISEESISDKSTLSTTVRLIDFEEKYRQAAPKSVTLIAKGLLEHCLWYFVREGGCSKITISDGVETVKLDELYDEYMHSTSQSETLEIKGHKFEITHLKFRASSSKTHSLSYCAANRLVKEEALTGKIPGLYGKVHDGNGDFIYSCYVSSPYLDSKVRSERTGFNLEENIEGLFSETDISLRDIRDAIIPSIKNLLSAALEENILAGKKRVNDFISEKAPRYRPIMARIPEEHLAVDAAISDRELEQILHQHLSEIERKIVDDGHSVMTPMVGESHKEYHARVREYLDVVADMKKSDLADYLCHRKVIIDLLQKSLLPDANGKYVTEDIVHELIIPMGHDSNSVTLESCNLWLIDEKLAFHDYLASDKTINSMPISGSTSTKEPDILSTNVYDNPLLMSEGSNLPLASIVVVELKRPMRNDAKAGEDKDPIEQSLGYLQRVRDGKAKTAAGRPIPNSQDIPGYCYIVCDLTETMINRCKLLNLTVTSDHMGYFGYNSNYKSYIEVISFDKLVDNAKKRNRAFFDKLGLPTQ